ncbi:hypothetical protein A2U01_0098225, partial [Trifolium medium]|nr:hypothetical protein [Trifolium medium]
AAAGTVAPSPGSAPTVARRRKVHPRG